MLSRQFKIIIFFIVSAFCSDALAQTSLNSLGQQGKISISANKIAAADLPAPGMPIELKAELNNTRDFRYPLKVLLVLDQEFQEFMSDPGLPDSREKPQYSIKIPAPVVEVEYQFVLTMPDGSFIVSPRQKVRRNCQPDISPAINEIDPAIDGSDKLNLLIVQNQKIEEELANLQSAVDEIRQLSGMLAK